MKRDNRSFHTQEAAFINVSYLDDVQLSDGLLSGQIKFALVVACADMGAHLPFVCSDPKANILIFQDFGHRTSQRGIADLIATGSVSNLIVYGHSDCDFARFLTKPVQQRVGEKHLILKYAQSDSKNFQQQYYSHLTKDEHHSWRLISEWSVLNELKSLLIYPQVLQRIERNQLKIHGWVYEIGDKSLHVFSPQNQKFVAATNQYVRKSVVEKSAR